VVQARLQRQQHAAIPYSPGPSWRFQSGPGYPCQLIYKPSLLPVPAIHYNYRRGRGSPPVSAFVLRQHLTGKPVLPDTCHASLFLDRIPMPTKAPIIVHANAPKRQQGTCSGRGSERRCILRSITSRIGGQATAGRRCCRPCIPETATSLSRDV
jgi:hypothetical protein